MRQIFKEEDGYSLVESLVALALLLAVLVPLTLVLIFVGGNTIAKDKITSFNYARNQMEMTLATEAYSSYAFQADERWWVQTEVHKDRNLYTIRVSTFKNDTLNEPHLELQTARLWYKE